MTMLTYEFFYNRKFLANILSFESVAHNFRIAIDAYLDPAINMHLNNGTIIMFKQCSGGVYYYDTINM